MEIKLSKFSKDMQNKILAAFQNDNKIDESEAKKLGLSKAEATALSRELSGKTQEVGDYAEFTRKDDEGNKQTLTLFGDKQEGLLKLTQDSIDFYRGKYPDANIKSAYLKDGVVTLLDKNGNIAKDSAGMGITIDFNSRLPEKSVDLVGFYLKHSGEKFDINKMIEYQSLQDRLNLLPETDESYLQLKSEIEIQKLSLMSYDERKDYITSKMWKAYQNRDFSAWADAIGEFYGYECEQIDDAMKIRAAKDFIKDKTRLTALVEYIDKHVDDHTSNLSTEELIWEVVKGVGDSIDGFIGTQGLTMIMGFGVATKLATSVPKIGGILGGAIQAYFGTDGSILIGSGVIDMATAETKEEARGAGANIGLGAIMVHGAKKSVSATVKTLEFKQFRTKLLETTTLDELNEYIEAIDSQPYSIEQKQVLRTECAKQFIKIEEYRKTNEKITDIEFDNPASQSSPEVRESEVRPAEERGADIKPAEVQAGESNSFVVPEGLDLKTVEGQIELAKANGLVESDITPAEAETIYKKHGLSDADIKEVRKANSNADIWMRTFDIFSEVKEGEMAEEWTVERIKEELKDMANEKQPDQQVYILLNETNLKWVQKMFHSPDRVSAIKDLFQFLDELHDNKEEFPEQYRIAKMAHELTGEPFAKMMYRAGNLWTTEQFNAFTPERIIAAKKISDTLGREFDLYDAKFIENPEGITPKFLAEYKSAMEQLEELNVKFDSGAGNPIDYLKDVKEGIDIIKKAGLDFSWYQDKNGTAKLPYHELFVIQKEQSKLHNAKEFMDTCSEKAKEMFSELIVQFAFDKGAENPQDIAKIFNLLCEKGREKEFNPRDFINDVSNYGKRENVDWHGVADLLEAYIKNNCLPNKLDAKRDMFVESGDFSGAVRLMNELKTFYDGAEEVTAANGTLTTNFFATFMANNWKHIITDKEIDFNAAVNRLQKLKKKNLQNELSERPGMLETILRTNDNGIVEKYETFLEKKITIDGDIYDSLVNPDVTAEDFRKNLELLEKLTKEAGFTIKETDSGNPLIEANSLLTNKQLVDLFNRIGGKLSASDKIWLMQAFSRTSRQSGQYAAFPEKAVDIINRMIKEDFDAEDISAIMKSLNSMSVSGMGYSLVDKLVFNEATRYPRALASKIMRAIKDPVQAKFAEMLCFDKELNFPSENIGYIVARVRPENFELAKKLCYDKDFPNEFIGDILTSATKNKVEFAERLCAEKDFPVYYIATIISRLKYKEFNGHNMELAETLCFDKELNFPKEAIADILDYTTDNNLDLITRLCTDKKINFPVKYTIDVAHSLKNAGGTKTLQLAEKLCTDKELGFPPEQTAGLLGYIREQNAEFIEKMVYTKDFLPKNLKKLAAYANHEARREDLEQLLTTTEIRRWVNKNIENFDVETVINLSRTQKKLFAEGNRVQEELDIQAKKETARQIQLEHQAAEIKADPMALDKISSALMEIGVPEGMAKNAYAKLCVDSNGNVDYTKLDAAKSLIKACGFYTRVNKKGQTAINPNLTPKDITEIFKLATGDKMSAQNGEFRPQIIQDIITLKECGVDDIKLAMNIASVKNMNPVEMKARFKGETRQDIAKRIDDITTNPSPQPSPEGRGSIAEALKSRGIDLEAVKEKARMSDKKIDDMKIKEGQGETGKIRQLDSIVGVEKVVLMKFKAEVDQSIWQDEAAFKRWAEEKLTDIIDWEKHPEYLAKGKFDAYNQPRREAFEKWVEYLNLEECNVHDDVFSKLLFLDGLTKEMKPDNAYTPPEISHEAFEAVYNQLLEGNTTVSITKAYASFNRTKAIQKYGKETTSKDGINGVWVKIPHGGQRGEPLYDEHIAMIQSLSEGSSWCLRFENAHTYLGYGDLHFFLTKQPDGSFVAQTAINVLPSGEIREIEKRYNQDKTVPVPYVQVIKEWQEANKFTGMENEMKQALAAKPDFDRQKEEFAKMQENGDVKGIFNALGIEIGDYEGGGYYLKAVNEPYTYRAFIKGKPYTLFDLGVDENWLMKDVVQVVGDMNLEGSALTAAPKLKAVTGRVNFGDNKIGDLRTLEYLNSKPVHWEKPETNPAKIREQGKRYDEKEGSLSSYEERMKRIAEMEADYNAEKAAENGETEIPKANTCLEELQERMLPDFADRDEALDKFFEDMGRVDLTLIEMADFKQASSIIKNKQLKMIAETICKNKQLVKTLMDYIRDIDAGLENIKDKRLVKYLRDELKKLSEANYEPNKYEEGVFDEGDFFRTLGDIGAIVDVYNTLNGNYTRYQSVELLGADIYSEASKPAAFMERNRLFAFMMSLEGDVKSPKITEFENMAKTEPLELLSNNKEILDYMYEKFYVAKLEDPKVRKLCRDINHTYGTRVILSANTRDIKRALKVIQNELENWKQKSGGKAKLPRILDLNSCDISYEDAMAYIDIRGNLHHNGGKIHSSRIIRHEIMHLNEPTMFTRFSADPELAKLIRSIIPSRIIEIDGRKKEVLDWENCKYREEFLKAGVDPEHISYAYTNKNEFLSVAAEGDLSQYTPEFREVLIKMGMPEYVFDLPLDDFKIECNVDRVKNILKEHPDADFDEIVEHIKKKREQEERNADALFEMIFGKKQ